MHFFSVVAATSIYVSHGSSSVSKLTYQIFSTVGGGLRLVHNELALWYVSRPCNLVKFPSTMWALNVILVTRVKFDSQVRVRNIVENIRAEQ